MLVKSGDTSQYGRCAIELFRMLIFVVSDEHLSLIIVRRDSLNLTVQIHLHFIIYSLSICKDRKTMKRMGLVNWVGIRPLRRNHMV